MKPITGTMRYVRAMQAGGLSAAWEGLSRPRKTYAAQLVEFFGWPVRVAVQHAYAFPYDEWPYNYRTHECVRMFCNRRTGRFF